MVISLAVASILAIVVGLMLAPREDREDLDNRLAVYGAMAAGGVLGILADWL